MPHPLSHEYPIPISQLCLVNTDVPAGVGAPPLDNFGACLLHGKDASWMQQVCWYSIACLKYFFMCYQIYPTGINIVAAEEMTLSGHATIRHGKCEILIDSSDTMSKVWGSPKRATLTPISNRE